MEVPGYTDLVPLGRGGFSTVYRARQVAVDRDVALKVLAVDLVDDAARNRFRRECATNGRVGAHPAVVTVYDSGFTSDGHPFLSMQLCPGGSLADALRNRGPLPVGDVLHAGVSIAAALAFAHSVGVLHRDIKPENILLSQFGEPLLADFGIATVDDQRVSTMTAASFTINHAAPECLAGAAPTPAADVYGLSSTLYTLLAGHPPFVAGTAAALVSLVSMVMNDPVPPLNRPDVPRSLSDLLVAGMAKNPAARPPDATAFGRGLQAVQSELGLPVTPWPAAPATSSVTATGATLAAGASGALAGAVGGALAGGAVAGTRGGTLPGTAPMVPPFATSGPTGGPPFAPGATANPGQGPGPGRPGPGAPASGMTPVLMPEEILPFAPSDPTRMGVVGPAAGSMTMVAGPGVRPAGGGPGTPGGPGGPGAGGSVGAGSTGPGRRSRTGTAIALSAAAVVIAIGVGAVLYFVAGKGDQQGIGAQPPGETTSVSQSASDTATASGSVSSSTETTTTSTETSSSTSPATSTEFGGTEVTVAPPPSTSLQPPDDGGHTQVAPPPPVTKPVTKTVVVTTTKKVGPSIDSFGDVTVHGGMVDCSGGMSTVTLQMIWSAPEATEAWIGIDSGPDASTAPFGSNLPPVVGPGTPDMPFFEVPFACSEQQHAYTLTVSGPGTKSSKTLIYQRAPLPTDLSSNASTGTP